MTDYSPVAVKIWGSYALFTGPFKTERVTYDVMTPSAARGVLEAIFWHKPMQWRVREIAVLNEIKRQSIIRNEVSSRAGPRKSSISITDERAQRSSLLLRDVCYIIRADAHIPSGLTYADPAKYRDQFRRRVQRGQCFHRPYLGCREFAGCFAPLDGSEMPISESRPLGRMLFDFDYHASNTQGASPHYFDAQLENGVLRIPDSLYQTLGTSERSQIS